MRNTDWKITLFFTAEILAFIIAGYSIALKDWGYVIVSMLFSMILAGATGKLIEKNAIENYKAKFNGKV